MSLSLQSLSMKIEAKQRLGGLILSWRIIILPVFASQVLP